jgi:hypothetical protein
MIQQNQVKRKAGQDSVAALGLSQQNALVEDGWDETFLHRLRKGSRLR